MNALLIVVPYKQFSKCQNKSSNNEDYSKKHAPKSLARSGIEPAANHCLSTWFLQKYTTTVPHLSTLACKLLRVCTCIISKIALCWTAGHWAKTTVWILSYGLICIVSYTIYTSWKAPQRVQCRKWSTRPHPSALFPVVHEQMWSFQLI